MNEELIRKLLIRNGQKIVLLNCPESLLSDFDGLEIISSPVPSAASDCVIGFVYREKELQEIIPTIKRILSPCSKLWIAYPKKNGSIDSDLSRDRIRELVNKEGLNPNRLISMNNDWSVMSLRDKNAQSKTSSFGQDPPGVDRKSKTVIPPDDFKEALSSNPEAEAFFESLAFSHRREYAGWIHEAKKPETRARRIIKAIEVLS